MLTVERSGSKQWWHVMYNGTMLDCCATKREAMACMEAYKAYEGML